MQEEDAMTTTTPGGTRHERTAETRERVVAAAHELFVAQGYRNTSLRDIAAAAGVSHPGVLRHFASKGDLLAAVVAELEAGNESVFRDLVDTSEPGTLVFSALAARNAVTDGYLELFAALTGEASAPGHPAHERMRERYARLRTLSTEVLADAAYHGVLADDREPEGESIRHTAGWDGLQLLSQYLPEQIDVVELLEEREELWAMPFGWVDPSDDPPVDEPAGPLPPLRFAEPREVDAGYAVGRKRRAQIVADAMQLFATTGYGDTSLRDIAQAVGVSKSTLLHHYASKELLLSAVLAERDSAIRTRTGAPLADRAADELRGISLGAARSAVHEPGLIEVYAVLSCEAVPAEHPAHEYFADRFRTTIDHFTELFRLAQADGDLPSYRDPAHEAIWLVALWDGLQYQWLYDRDAVDIAAHLAAHLDDVLPRYSPDDAAL